jgi:hypothetical protein
VSTRLVPVAQWINKLIGPKMNKRSCINACRVRLNPILGAVDYLYRLQSGKLYCARFENRTGLGWSIDPSSLGIAAAEGAPCYSGPTGNRTRKVVEGESE